MNLSEFGFCRFLLLHYIILDTHRKGLKSTMFPCIGIPAILQIMENTPVRGTKRLKKPLFSDPVKNIRYVATLLMVSLMVGVACLTGEKEIIFPEMAALCIGFWIVNKRVWIVRPFQAVLLMTVGAVAGIVIARYSPFNLVVNISGAFTFAALCLLLYRSTLIPMLSACILPVILGTVSWIYPLSVFTMTLIVIAVRKLMELTGTHTKQKAVRMLPAGRKDVTEWAGMLVTVVCVAFAAVFSSFYYFIIPPLVVTFAEFVTSRSGFRLRPVQVFLMVVGSSAIGTYSQLVGYGLLGLPEIVVASFVMVLLFIMFELVGKYFAPAGALALIPMIVPQDGLAWMPLQVAAGAAIFITVALIFFQRCYKWSRAQLVYCLVPRTVYAKRRRHTGD